MVDHCLSPVSKKTTEPSMRVKKYRYLLHSHKFITIEFGKTSLPRFLGKLRPMSLLFCVVWENYGRLLINLEVESFSALFLNEIGKPMQQA